MRTFVFYTELPSFQRLAADHGLHLATLALPSDKNVLEVSLRMGNGEELDADTAFMFGRAIEQRQQIANTARVLVPRSEVREQLNFNTVTSKQN